MGVTRLNQSLTKRVFRAGLWSAAGFLLGRVLGFVRLAILARLLAPDDFGLFALVTVFVGGIEALTDAGIVSAVVRKRLPDETYLSTAWAFECVRGMLLAIVCWSVAPWIAEFFGRPDLIELLRLAALAPLFQGLKSLGIPLLTKELTFSPILLTTLAHEVFQTLVSIGFAWGMGWKASSLVYGLLAGHLAAGLVSFWIHPFRPRWLFSWDVVRELWAYGGHLLGAGILIYAMTNLDDAVIGRILGASALGQYTVAFTLAGYMTSKIVNLSNQVMFPAYSGIQMDVERMLAAIKRHARLTALVLTPLVAGGALFPEAIIQLALGTQWLSAASVFVVLLLMGWIRAFASVFGPVLLALGRTRGMHKMKWIEFVVFAVLIVPAVQTMGISGAAWVLVIVYAISLVLHLWLLRIHMGVSFQSLTTGLVHGAVPGLLAGLSVYVLKPFLEIKLYGGWWLVLVFVSIWAGVMWRRERSFLRDVWHGAIS